MCFVEKMMNGIMFPLDSICEFYVDGSNDDPNWTISEEIKEHFLFTFMTFSLWLVLIGRNTSRS